MDKTQPAATLAAQKPKLKEDKPPIKQLSNRYNCARRPLPMQFEPQKTNITYPPLRNFCRPFYFDASRAPNLTQYNLEQLSYCFVLPRLPFPLQFFLVQGLLSSPPLPSPLMSNFLPPNFLQLPTPQPSLPTSVTIFCPDKLLSIKKQRQAVKKALDRV